MPYPRQLLQIDFDQFYRYSATTILLKPLIQSASPSSRRPIRILEVGCHSLNLLPAFLASLPVEIVRADLQPDFDDGTGPYVQLTRNSPIPFDDDSVDYVVALEVLEHIPPQDRAFTVSEWSRVSRCAIIVSCPNGKRVRSVELRADHAYRLRHGNQPHPWLEEHERYGQPIPSEVRSLLRQFRLFCFSFANSPLAEWLPLLMATEEIHEHGSRELVKRFNEMLNLRPFRSFIRKGAYRRIYIGFKTKMQAQVARQLWHHELVNNNQQSSQNTIDPVLVLSQKFTQLLKDGQSHIAGARQAQILKRQINEYRNLFDETQNQILQQRWTLESYATWSAHFKTFWRSVLRRLGLSGASVSSGHEVYQLKKKNLNCWHSFGQDPQFVWSTHYSPGWYHVVVRGQVLQGEHAKVYLDYGHGFSESTAFSLGTWPAGPRRLTAYTYFHHPVSRIRFDPAENPTPVQLDALSIRPRKTWQVMLAGLTSLVNQFVRKPSDTYKQTVDAISSWKFGRFLLEKASEPNANIVFTDNPYQAWLESERPSIEDRRKSVQQLKEHTSPQSFELSAILSLPKKWSFDDVRRSVRSLLKQDKECLEIWLIATKDDQVKLQQYSEITGLQSRLKWLIIDSSTPLSAAYRHCLEKITASHVLPLWMGDKLEPDAVAQLLEKAHQHPKAAIIYFDEDHFSEEQGYVQPLLKPDKAPESFFHQPTLLGYTAALNCLCLRELGGFHPTYEGALLSEFFYRVLKRGNELAHIRRVLVHHPSNRILSHGQQLVQERLVDAYGSKSEIASNSHDASLISIIIPSAARSTIIQGKEEMHLARCLSSIKFKSTYENYELLVVHNEKLSFEAETVIAHFGAKSISIKGPFNFSRNINEAAKVARGSQLLLLNDDTEVLSSDWLEKLIFFSRQAEIGAVGAKLFFPDGSIQHVGIALSKDGPGHPYYRAPRETTGYLNCCLEPRNWIAVTGACLMTSRQAFEAVNGLDETFELNYNDVDYCLRLWQIGYRCVCDPTVELYHFESMRADGRSNFRPEELERFNARWKKRYPHDPYFVTEPC